VKRTLAFAGLALLLIVVFAMIVLLPISIIQRYRVGTSRSQARRSSGFPFSVRITSRVPLAADGPR